MGEFKRNFEEEGLEAEVLPAHVVRMGMCSDHKGDKPDTLFLKLAIPGGHLTVGLSIKNAIALRETLANINRIYPGILS